MPPLRSRCSLPVMSPDTGLGNAGGTAGSGGSSGSAGNDWAALATAKVGDVVSLIRDRIVTPVIRAVRFIILGVLALAIGALLSVLIAIGAVRVLDNYLFHQRVWASYLVVGGIFSIAGLFLSWMRHPRS
jgi:hypothetical protein